MKRLIAFLFCITITASLYAYNWEADGYTVVQPEEGEEEPIGVQLKTPSGKSITILNEENVNAEKAATIREISGILFGFQYISVESITFDVRRNTMRILAVPESFVYNDRDMIENLTAGLSFFYESGALKYNFRIKYRSMYIRIDGAYIDEASLCAKIEEAVSDPQSFIARRDSEYLLQKINDLEEKIKQLETSVVEADKQLAENDRILQETDRTLMRNDRVIVSNIQKVQKESRETDEKIRTAQIAYHNNEVLAGEKPISKEIIKAVLDIHKQNPSLDVDGIAEICKERELEVSKKEINIILVSYENIFPEK